MPAGISQFEGRQRAFVKIQDGCILKCSYCIIPTVRPGLRSRRPADIEDEIRRLIDNGYQEIVISGVHVGHFGVDTNHLHPGDTPERLWHLLRRLDRIPGQWRMRLSSIESVEVNDDFISAAGDCEHLCPQFHPALQSGSDSVLTRMRRRYRVSRFLERLEQIRERLGNDPAFTTDIIVGFPGETDAEFEETLETCRKARFMKVHVFPFSRRDGTPAAEMKDQVPPQVIRERVQRLSDLERDLALDFYQSKIGLSAPTLEVLVERTSEHRPGYVRGTDRWYIPVEVPGTEADQGQFVYCTGNRCQPSRRNRQTGIGDGQRSNSMSCLIAIEGIDGSGKGTQSCSSCGVTPFRRLSHGLAAVPAVQRYEFWQGDWRFSEREVR